MKTKLSRKLNAAGNALVVALVTCTILSMAMAYYLALVEQQNKLSFRSQAWNTAIAITEAGIEEGMEQLNVNVANLATDGWTQSGTVYSRTYTFTNGDSYTSTISPTSDMFHPFTVTARSSVSPGDGIFLAAIGVNTTTPSVARAIIVQCARGNLLIKGMVAKHQINMNGNNILTDSFDSTDPSWSTLGHYTPTKTKANGDVATNDSITNGVNSGNANIYGHVNTGPGGTVAVTSQGGIGDQAWVSNHLGQIETGYLADNANFTFPETPLPYTVGLDPAHNLDVSVTNYVYSTNATTSSTYPSPPPAGGVITNVTWSTVNNRPSPPPPGLTTNCSAQLVKVKNFPAAGTYCGSPYQTGNDVNWWYYYPPVNYTYPTYQYTYNVFSSTFTVTTSHYDNILYTGDYKMDTLSGKTLVLGNARLVATSGINMTGTDFLQIGQTASLLAYVAGTSSTLGGNGLINSNGYAVNCQIYCTSTVKSFTFNGNGDFIGVLIAPDADVTMNGGGHTWNDFEGALMASSVKMNGHYRFHYDESLGKNGATGRYIVTSWDEIKAN